MNMAFSRTSRLRLLWALAVLAVAIALVAPAIPQDPAYHMFADGRAFLGIPNFWNVASNLPFLLVGLAGVLESLRTTPPGMLPTLRPAYLLFFAGVALVGPGSAYYHLAPHNPTLVWDRVPMTIAFMAFFSIILGEQVSPEAGRKFLGPLVLLGLASIVYWRVTERLGHGDLRAYALIQFLPILLIPLLLWLFRPPFSGTRHLWAMFGFYLAAKVAELLDAVIFQYLGLISGHSLKHLLAAAGVYCVLLGLRRRRPRPSGAGGLGVRSGCDRGWKYAPAHVERNSEGE